MISAAWVYSENEKYIGLAEKNNIKEFFTEFADIYFTKGIIDLSRKKVTSAWQNAGRVYPLISSPGPEGIKLNEISKDYLEEVINTLKDNGICEYDGINVDIEPYHCTQLRFLDLLKSKTGKKISASLGKWDFAVLECIDTAVLMAYDYHKDPAQYLEIFKTKVKRFGEDCEKQNTSWMVGLPIVATHTEYDSVWEGYNEKLPTGQNMNKYFLPAYNFLKDISKDTNHFKGISVWAFLRHPLTKEGLCIWPWEMDSDSLESLD